MTGPHNGRYQRRFIRPEDRPSNMPFPQWAASETARQLRCLHEAIDEQDGKDIICGLEAMLKAEARRLAARMYRRGGDPGE